MYEITVVDSYIYPYDTYTWPSTSNTVYYYPNKEYVYLYQLECPKCKRSNWCELNKQVVCKCKSVLRAVSEKVDYEIAVKE